MNPSSSLIPSTFIAVLQEIVEERELCLHFVLNKNLERVQFAVWYLNGVIHLLIACVVFTVVLKVCKGNKFLTELKLNV